ncbi:hypothetical protein PHLCEN_2v12882 [Hermanssonia centrifuga]|uniref:Uncharacterized protein n=1 Tax=Hermanssonia centrifuga TaxID=98765 RepID=A0A2R6NG39_9APHY|nr:hypothetical protein PHLCEN_2v12882 [Hermanssonia centrifuga]
MINYWATLRGLEPSDVQQLLNPQTYVPASSTSNVGLNHATAPLQTPVDDAGQIFSHFPDKDTLDIWSNAPNSFE